MTDLPTRLIAVTAIGHPERDAWVEDRATEEAFETGVALGDYLGRETVLPEPRDAGLCCHLYAVDDGSERGDH